MNSWFRITGYFTPILWLPTNQLVAIKGIALPHPLVLFVAICSEMKWMVLLLTLLSVNIRCLWARSNGAPRDACDDLMPQHTGATSAPMNPGFFLMGDVIENRTYVPGETYESKMMRKFGTFYSIF